MITKILETKDCVNLDISQYIKEEKDIIIDGMLESDTDGWADQVCYVGLEANSNFNKNTIPLLMNSRDSNKFHKVVYVTNNLNYKDSYNFFDQIIYLTDTDQSSLNTIKKKYYTKNNIYLKYYNSPSMNHERHNVVYTVDKNTQSSEFYSILTPNSNLMVKDQDRQLDLSDLKSKMTEISEDDIFTFDEHNKQNGVIIFKANNVLTKDTSLILFTESRAKPKRPCYFYVNNDAGYDYAYSKPPDKGYAFFRSGRKDNDNNQHRVLYTMDLDFKDPLGLFDVIVYISDKKLPVNNTDDYNPTKESYFTVDYSKNFWVKSITDDYGVSVYNDHLYSIKTKDIYNDLYKLPYATQSLSLINYSDNKSQPWIFRETHYINDPDIENIYSRNENSFIEVQHKGLIGAYDHLYRKISYLDTTKTYKLSFKYKINFVDKQGHTVTDSNYPSYLTLLPDSHNFKYYGYFNGFYKSTELKMNTTDYQTFTAEFTPTSSVIYPSFEFGALRGYIDIKISEFKIEEDHKIQRQISIPNDQVWFTNYSEGFSYKNGISESGSYGVDITQYLNSENWEKNYTILDLKPRTEYKISFIAKYDYKGGHAYFNVYGESAAKSKMLGEFNQNYGGDNITASEFGGIELNRNDSQQKTLKFTTKDEGKIYLFFSYANLDDHNTLKFSVQNLQITELTNDPSYGEVKLNENIKQTDNLIIYRNHIVNSLFRRTKQLYRLTFGFLSDLVKKHPLTIKDAGYYGIRSYTCFPEGVIDTTSTDYLICNRINTSSGSSLYISNDTYINVNSAYISSSANIDDYSWEIRKQNYPDGRYQFQLITSASRKSKYSAYSREKLAEIYKGYLQLMDGKYGFDFKSYGLDHMKRFDFVGYKDIDTSPVAMKHPLYTTDESKGFVKILMIRASDIEDLMTK